MARDLRVLVLEGEVVKNGQIRFLNGKFRSSSEGSGLPNFVRIHVDTQSLVDLNAIFRQVASTCLFYILLLVATVVHGHILHQLCNSLRRKSVRPRKEKRRQGGPWGTSGVRGVAP